MVLDVPDIEAHRAALQVPVDGRPLGPYALGEPVDASRLWVEVRDRLAAMRERLASGQYVTADGSPLDARALAAFEAPSAPAQMPSLEASVHVATAPVPLRCGPYAGRLVSSSEGRIEPRHDRNACSTARTGELVERLARWPGGMWLARTSYALGFIAHDAPLGPALSGAEREVQRARATQARALTRRTWLEQAFALLGTPYGWGDEHGGRDCSRLVLDVMAHFGIPVPRHSGRQALAGSWSVDVFGGSVADKLDVADRALRRGVVLLHFPGHVMLYLGRDEGGTPMVLHSFAEYLEPCPDGGEGLRTVDRVSVSDLRLGAGSSRGSFAERLSRVVVFGRPPDADLRETAEWRHAVPVERPPPRCADSTHVAIFRSPRTPHVGQPLRVIATSGEHPGPAELVLFDPSGRRHAPPVHRLGGPPYAWWAEIERPARGAWIAVLGEGERVFACERIVVAAGPPTPVASSDGPVWEARWRWEQDTENLYAAFVEQLFRVESFEDRSWRSLSELLVVRERNLLFDHFSRGEEARLRLQPDCADLPYVLRAYFAWKLGLPFGFRACSRGRADSPPRCGPLRTNLEPRRADDEVSAFAAFARDVMSAAHSASARTAPSDEATDLYPVPLDRQSLAPGTVFADPYGHLLVLVQWLPQRPGRPGMLLAVDGQPDGTIALKRFWRGTFLFDPDTTAVGAGFKAWRPVRLSADGTSLEAAGNRELQAYAGPRSFSLVQYEGSAVDFYDRVHALVDPRPIEPEVRMRGLVDALHEAVLRRVQSVQNGVDWAERNGWPVVPMPEGHDVFETSGPWEDYATPSRDMRLLIAIDIVRGFPDEVLRSPARFGLSAERAAALAPRLRERLPEELRARSFEYRRSDGRTARLSLEDLVARERALEVAYNPNDCPEIRWGEPADSEAMRACVRRAPAEQRERMERYRVWFRERRRPPRGTRRRDARPRRGVGVRVVSANGRIRGQDVDVGSGSLPDRGCIGWLRGLVPPFTAAFKRAGHGVGLRHGVGIGHGVGLRHGVGIG
ncbi:MAG: C40 family peptidase, partial [Myxococcota bacterium]|nr:C40 family peptidase [Myxococcota bacterium]